jgi:hypothetical protein
MAQLGKALPSTISTSANLELNCLVFGDPERLFTVSVANNDKVSKLQKAIRVEKEPELDHLPADALKLWKVNVSC